MASTLIFPSREQVSFNNSYSLQASETIFQHGLQNFRIFDVLGIYEICRRKRIGGKYGCLLRAHGPLSLVQEELSCFEKKFSKNFATRKVSPSSGFWRLGGWETRGRRASGNSPRDSKFQQVPRDPAALPGLSGLLFQKNHIPWCCCGRSHLERVRRSFPFIYSAVPAVNFWFREGGQIEAHIFTAVQLVHFYPSFSSPPHLSSPCKSCARSSPPLGLQ
ncbi:uncharacterized protein LOC124505207 [Lynx rufus]|uniref:uncharacterized protein LOC124505207 n=1 Tax=Lynx rufus TaxID=61384 RepID=UPI001F12487C|nr:uncharacterized protein LOC124505207 [Lynx rufus]